MVQELPHSGRLPGAIPPPPPPSPAAAAAPTSAAGQNATRGQPAQ